MTIFRPKITPDDILPILPKLLCLVFGHWKVQPTITVEKDHVWLDCVSITVTHPDDDVSHEITDLASAFIDGYLVGIGKDFPDETPENE